MYKRHMQKLLNHEVCNHPAWPKMHSTGCGNAQWCTKGFSSAGHATQLGMLGSCRLQHTNQNTATSPQLSNQPKRYGVAHGVSATGSQLAAALLLAGSRPFCAYYFLPPVRHAVSAALLVLLLLMLLHSRDPEGPSTSSQLSGVLLSCCCYCWVVAGARRT
jgi:hypothetical protein